MYPQAWPNSCHAMTSPVKGLTLQRGFALGRCKHCLWYRLRWLKVPTSCWPSHRTRLEPRYFAGGHFVLDEYADVIAEAIIETFSR